MPACGSLFKPRIRSVAKDADGINNKNHLLGTHNLMPGYLSWSRHTHTRKRNQHSDMSRQTRFVTHGLANLLLSSGPDSRFKLRIAFRRQSMIRSQTCLSYRTYSSSCRVQSLPSPRTIMSLCWKALTKRERPLAWPCLRASEVASGVPWMIVGWLSVIPASTKNLESF